MAKNPFRGGAAMETPRYRRSPNTKSFFFIPSALLALLFILASCGLQVDWSFSSDEGAGDGDGMASLLLNIQSDFQMQTLLPDVDTTASSYEIVGSGPDGSGFTIVTEDTTVEIASLEPGD